MFTRVRPRRGHQGARRASRGPLRAFGSGGIGVLLLGVLAFLWCPPLVAPLAAQALGGESEVQYREAVETYETLRRELDRSLNRFERALEAVDRSRQSTDSGREDALAAFQTVAVNHMSLERETQRALDRLNQARVEYLRALEARENVLLEALADEDLPPVRQAALESSWQQIRREMLELEPAGELEETISLRPVPELRVEPTDGPIELREKASFMRDHALSYDSIIGDLDREIQALEERERQLRGLQDLQRDLGRFGQDLLPGAGRGSPSVPNPERSGDGVDVEPRGEGTAEALAALPLPEQIELLRGTRRLAVEYREEALAMADVFRARAEDFGP